MPSVYISVLKGYVLCLEAPACTIVECTAIPLIDILSRVVKARCKHWIMYKFIKLFSLPYICQKYCIERLYAPCLGSLCLIIVECKAGPMIESYSV
jgi:hypothetical protein